MKKHILNRPMFRQVKSPAYGTGIATNLVSDEERQRYNYGGRVGYDQGDYISIAQEAAPLGVETWYTPEYFKKDFYERYIPKVIKKVDYMNQTPYDMDYGMQMDLAPFVSTEDKILYERFQDPDKTTQYYEKEWLPAQQKKYAKKIEAQKKMKPEIFEEKTEVVEDKSNWKDKYLGGDPVNVEKEKIEETNTIGLTENEKNALLASGMFTGAAKAATSKGKKWQDVLGDAIGGVAAGLGVGTSPAKLIQDRKEQENKYAAATKMYKEVADAAAIREAKPENIFTTLVGKGGNPVAAMSAAHGGANIKFVPKANPKIKNSQEMRDNELTNLKEGDIYFDENEPKKGWKVKGPGDESITISVSKVHEILKTR